VGPGEDAVLDGAALDAAYAYIATHPEIREVILTGGDPFVLAPRRIEAVTRALDAIAHVKILRWHTRALIADPPCVTPDLVRALKRTRKAIYVVLHSNHARELTEDVREACARLIDAGIPMLSQSVLLAGVNDDIATLEALMRALVEMRIKPYYLHHADLAPGTSHFRTSIEKGRALAQALHARCSGLAQPVYVLDIPGGHAKARLAESDCVMNAAEITLRDGKGETHSYPSGSRSEGS
jgi:lysine 2,3-aminomutase